MPTLEGLTPERVFYYFEELTKIPHGSYHTKEISDYLVAFAKEKNLEYRQDEANNVVIIKPATAGHENAPVTIIQGHCDMVCEKTPDSDHDFTKDPLELAIDGDMIYAKGTTLGGDDGIAVAYALAILESDSIEHPALEVVITTDEEVGLLGAAALDCSDLKGRYLLNIDSETEGEILVGCAGGLSAKSYIPVDYRERSGVKLNLSMDGLKGGHSGVDISKIRANATILMGRFLYELAQQVDYDLIDLVGGTKDNAITRRALASLMVEKEDVETVSSAVSRFEEEIGKEYAGSDEGMEFACQEKGQQTCDVMTPASKAKVIFYLMNIPNGIQKMSGVIEGLVETSTNMGILNIANNTLITSSGVRSSVPSGITYIANKIQFLTEFLGGEYEEQGAYPAWEYRKESTLRPLMIELYEKQYGEKPKVEVIHAGLECGLFFEKISGLDCVSFGPNIFDIHTTEEKLSISSVQRTWEYILAILKEIK